MEVDGLAQLADHLGPQRVEAHEQALEQLRVGEVVAARVAGQPVLRAHDHEAGVQRRARHGIPGGAERRVERERVAPHLDAGDPHQRPTSATAVVGVGRLLALVGQRPHRIGPGGRAHRRWRRGWPLGWPAFTAGLVVGLRIDPDATSTITSAASSASSRPSATASSTPCAMPSWAAPQARRSWRSSSIVTLLTKIVAGRTGVPAPEAGEERQVTRPRAGHHGGRRRRRGRAAPGQHQVDVASVRHLAGPGLADPRRPGHRSSGRPARSSTTRAPLAARRESKASPPRRAAGEEIRRSSGRRPCM